MGPIDPILRVWGWGGRVVGRDGPYCFDRGLLSLYCCPYCCCSHYYCCPHSPPSPFSTPWFLHATYTADSGERRLRIFNQRLQSTSTYPRLFKGLDGVAVMLSLARTAALQLDSTRLPDVRSNFEDAVPRAVQRVLVHRTARSPRKRKAAAALRQLRSQVASAPPQRALAFLSRHCLSARRYARLGDPCSCFFNAFERSSSRSAIRCSS